MLALVLFLSFAAISCLSFEMYGNTNRCFIENMSKGSYLSGTYSINSPNQQTSTEIKVLDPRGHALYNQKSIKQGEFSLKMQQNGEYSVCLYNSIKNIKQGESNQEYPPVVVSLNIDHLKKLEYESDDDLAYITRELNLIERMVKSAQKDNSYTKARENEMVKISKKTNMKITVVGVIFVIIIIAACLIETYMMAKLVRKTV